MRPIRLTRFQWILATKGEPHHMLPLEQVIIFIIFLLLKSPRLTAYDFHISLDEMEKKFFVVSTYHLRLSFPSHDRGLEPGRVDTLLVHLLVLLSGRQASLTMTHYL